MAIITFFEPGTYIPKSEDICVRWYFFFFDTILIYYRLDMYCMVNGYNIYLCIFFIYYRHLYSADNTQCFTNCTFTSVPALKELTT